MLKYEGLQKSLVMHFLTPSYTKKHADDAAFQHATPVDLGYFQKKAAVLADHDLVGLKLQHLFPQDQCGYANTTVR